ncbi:ankyrin repeat domain-containing protein [Candidatus Babeliales bacterium]|nr:ankyrin repeat domain-containing protein [Candidatus Babeliales bacterium]
MKNFHKVLLGTALAASMVSFDVNAAATPTTAKRTERPLSTEQPLTQSDLDFLTPDERRELLPEIEKREQKREAHKAQRTNTTPAASTRTAAQQATELDPFDSNIFGPDLTPTPSISTTPPILATRLHELAQIGNVAALQQAVVTPEILNTPNATGKTALHLAVAHNHETCVFVLMQKDANPNTRDADGNTPLHTAIANGSISCVNILLRTALLDLVNNDGNTPLHAAVIANNSHIVALMAKQAQPAIFTTRNYLFETPLHVAAQRGHTNCLIELVESGNTALNTANLAGNTALHLAAINGHGDCVQILLASGANPTIQNLERNTFRDEAHKAGTFRHIIPFIEVLEQPEPTVTARSGRFSCAIQ